MSNTCFVEYWPIKVYRRSFYLIHSPKVVVIKQGIKYITFSFAGLQINRDSPSKRVRWLLKLLLIIIHLWATVGLILLGSLWFNNDIEAEISQILRIC